MVMQRDRMAAEKAAIEKLKDGSSIGDSDNVNHPPHYNNGKAHCECGRRIECIDITRHHNFNIGNAIKYLWRSELKGATIEDLRKAIWYIQDEIKSIVK